MTTPAGWYPDTTAPGTERYWDGAQWTEHSRPVGNQPPPPPVPAAQSVAPVMPGAGTAMPGSVMPAVAPKKKHTVRNVILTLTALFILGVGGCLAVIGGAAHSIDKNIKKDTAAAIADVTLTHCGRKGPLGEVGVDVAIKNSDMKSAQDYSVTIAFVGANGDQLGTGYASADSLQPGQVKRDFASPSDYGVDSKYAGMTCKVTDATAFEVSAK